eukprot:2432404-Pyramimonas_sp.AAC.1
MRSKAFQRRTEAPDQPRPKYQRTSSSDTSTRMPRSSREKEESPCPRGHSLYLRRRHAPCLGKNSCPRPAQARRGRVGSASRRQS